MKRLKTCCYLDPSSPTQTPAQRSADDWMTKTDIGTSSMILGKNTEVYIDALKRRGFSDGSGFTLVAGAGGTYPSISLTTTDATLAFAGLFDMAFLLNWPSETFVQELKRRSRRGTKVVLGFLNYETVPQAPNLNSVADSLDSYLTPTYRLAGSGVPTPGHDTWPAACTGLDPFMATDYGVAQEFATTCGGHDASLGSKHCWMVNVGDAGLLSGGWHQGVSLVMGPRYPKKSPDYYIMDNHNPARSVGTAGPTYSAGNDSNYVGGLTLSFLNAKRYITQAAGGVPTGANGCGLGIAYPGTTEEAPTYWTPADLPLRFMEFFFCDGDASSNTAKAWDVMTAQLDLMKKYPGVTLLGSVVRTSAANYNAGTRVQSETWGYNNGSTPHATWRGPGQALAGQTDRGDWDRLAAAVAQRGLSDKVYVMNARVGTSQGLFYDAVFGRV